MSYNSLKLFLKKQRFLRQQRLKKGTTITFSDMNLRYFVFLRWAYFTKTSQVFDTLDRLSLFWEIRSAFRQWRVSVFGVGFTMAVQASVKSIVKSTTAKLSEKIAPHRDENVPAIETSGGWASRLAGLLSKNK